MCFILLYFQQKEWIQERQNVMESRKPAKSSSNLIRPSPFSLVLPLWSPFVIFLYFRNLLVRGVKHFNVKEPKAVFKEFIVWLQKFENPVLIGHNGFRFDAPVIIRSMIRFGLFGDFKDACKLFGDTLVPMKSYFGSESCKLTKLGASYIPGWTRYKEKAHSALFDVWATIQILKIKRLEFKNSSFKPIGDLIPTRTDPNKVAQDSFLFVFIFLDFVRTWMLPLRAGNCFENSVRHWKVIFMKWSQVESSNHLNANLFSVLGFLTSSWKRLVYIVKKDWKIC